MRPADLTLGPNGGNGVAGEDCPACEAKLCGLLRTSVPPRRRSLQRGERLSGKSCFTLWTVLDGLVAHLGLTFEGVMGYEPHLAKLPGLLRGAATRRVQSALAQGADLTRAHGGTLVNTGGSMTFASYTPDHGATEVALGSVLAKPTDFDLPATEAFQPALFIATPILKYLPGNPLPGLDWLPAGKRRAHIAVYGGYWKAKPVWPAGYTCSGVFGHSSNQEMWAGPVMERSPVDDFALLRPTQSEAILPEFGEVLVHSRGQITERWRPCLWRNKRRSGRGRPPIFTQSCACSRAWDCAARRNVYVRPYKR